MGDLYFISLKGLNYLNSVYSEYYHYKVKMAVRAAPQLLSTLRHRIFLINYWISLEQQLLNSREFDLELFCPEFKKLPNGSGITLRAILPNGNPIQVRNDALFIVTHKKTRLRYLFGLEVDRGTMPITQGNIEDSIAHKKLAIRSSIQNKYDKIQSVFSCGSQAFQNLGSGYDKFQGMRVIFVSKNTSKLQGILKKITISHSLRDKNIFLFSHEKEFQENGAWNCRYATFLSRSGLRTLHLPSEIGNN